MKNICSLIPASVASLSLIHWLQSLIHLFIYNCVSFIRFFSCAVFLSCHLLGISTNISRSSIHYVPHNLKPSFIASASQKLSYRPLSSNSDVVVSKLPPQRLPGTTICPTLSGNSNCPHNQIAFKALCSSIGYIYLGVTILLRDKTIWFPWDISIWQLQLLLDNKWNPQAHWLIIVFHVKTSHAVNKYTTTSLWLFQY